MAGKVEIWADGSCRGNPGPAGWAAVLRYGEHERQLFGSEPHATNQRMELRAVVEGLRALKRSCDVVVYSDSAYVVNGMLRRSPQLWKKRNWRTAAGTPVANRELWEQLGALNEHHNVEWVKVKGHADDEGNNLAHGLAYACSQKQWKESQSCKNG